MSTQKLKTKPLTPITELSAEDYYWANGYIVFTEKYHLKRGSCCKSGCRHCPFKEGNKGRY